MIPVKVLIAQHLLDVHEGGNWTEVSLKEILVDVDFIEASLLTPASPNTIASLLSHISFWNRVMVERIAGIEVEVPVSNGYDAKVLSSEAEWTTLKNDNTNSSLELANAILKIDEQKLLQEILPGRPTMYKSLQGSVEHVHYHLGQMVIIKNLAKQIKQNASFIT